MTAFYSNFRLATCAAILLLANFAFFPTTVDERPTQEEFANLVIKALSKMTDTSFTFDAENFRLIPKDKDKDSNEINLSNVYLEHLSLEEPDRPDNILKIASVFSGRSAGLPKDFELAKSNLRPKIWSRLTLEHMKLRQRLDGKAVLDLPLKPLGEHLYTSLVYDTPNAMRSVSNKNLESWNVTFEDALVIACENLHKSTVAYSRIGDHFHSSISGDSYDSSRVMLDHVRTFEVKGEHVALVPNRNLLQIAGSDDPQSLTMMFELAVSEEEVRPLCPLPLIWKDDQWQDWTPPEDHEIRRIFDERNLQFMGQMYAEQQAILQQVFEHEEQDIFVSSFSAMQNPETKAIRSYCVWSNGVKSLLPKTQLVVISDKDGVPSAIGEWDHVREVVGDLIEVDDSVYPTRYRVKGFPTAEQLKEIGKAEF